MREITCCKARDNFIPLKNELEELAVNGVKLTIDGREGNPEYIARQCIMAEDYNYMRDYVTDDAGKIVKVDFNRITLTSI